MPLSLRRGTVTAVVEEVEGLARIEVDGEPCVAYPRLTGAVEVGDEVVVNVQARELELGSGGFDVLYANLTRGLGLEVEPDAHVMTLPYTPLQSAVRFVEEDGGLAESLEGMPVVCCSLHSQVAPAVAGVGGGVRVAYVQLPGGALPVSLSDSVRALKAARARRDGGCVGRVLRRRRAGRGSRIGARLGRGAGVRRRCLLGRPRDRGDGLAAGARWARSGRCGERGECARRIAGAGRPCLARR